MTNSSIQFGLTAAIWCILAVFACMPSYANENPTLGNTTEPPNAQHVDDKKAKKQQGIHNKKVCKRVKVTGTHFRKRVCNTQAGWRELQNQSQEAMRELSRGRSTSN